MPRLAAVCLFLAMLCANFARPSQFAGAAENPANRAVLNILSIGWLPTPDALEQSQAIHRKAAALAPTDARLDFALALVAIKTERNADAIKLLDEALKKNPQLFPAGQFQIGLLAGAKKYDEALARMQALSALYPQKPAALATEKQLVETADIMGRVFGYLNGPGVGSLSASLLVEKETAIAAKLGPAHKQAFAAGKQAVLDDFKQRQAEISASRQKESSDDARKDELDRQFVEKESVRITTEKAELEKQATDAKTVFDAESAKINTALEPLQKRYAEVMKEAEPLAKRLKEMNESGASLASAMRGLKDRGAIDRAGKELDRLASLIRGDGNKLKPLDTEARKLQGQAAQLQGQMQTAQSKYQTIMQGLNAKNNKLKQAQKQVDSLKRKLEAPDNDSPKVKLLAKQLTAWETYQPLTLEQHRQKMLESVTEVP